MTSLWSWGRQKDDYSSSLIIDLLLRGMASEESVSVCTRDVPYVDLYTSLTEWFFGNNVQSSINRPSLCTTMDRGSWGKAKPESWSIHPFISRIPTQPPLPPPPPLPGWPAPSQHAQAGSREQGWGAAMQVIRATTVMTTNHWGNCCSNKLCSVLSAILSTISFINGMWCHGSDYTPVTSDPNMCLYVRTENKSVSFKHTTSSAPGNKQSALFVPYNKQYGCELMGGGHGTKPHSIYAIPIAQTPRNIYFQKRLLPYERQRWPNFNKWWHSECFQTKVEAVALYKHKQLFRIIHGCSYNCTNTVALLCLFWQRQTRFYLLAG